MYRPLLFLAAGLWTVSLAGCRDGANALARKTRQHALALTTMYARLPPTPANLPLLNEKIASYREKHAGQLATLRAIAARLVESSARRDQLAVDAYCALDRMLAPERHGRPLGGAKTPLEARERLAQAGAKAKSLCRAALRRQR